MTGRRGEPQTSKRRMDYSCIWQGEVGRKVVDTGIGMHLGQSREWSYWQGDRNGTGSHWCKWWGGKEEQASWALDRCRLWEMSRKNDVTCPCAFPSCIVKRQRHRENTRLLRLFFFLPSWACDAQSWAICRLLGLLDLYVGSEVKGEGPG